LLISWRSLFNNLEQLRAQSDSLTKTLDRERAAKEELQKQAVDMLRTVRPAFKGDLTVRANVTENEIGTIAGAYNTTLDSLKDIVQQVQIAAEQVAQTTGDSSVAIEGLSMQSQTQLQELGQALDRIEAMISASTVTTENAQKVEIAIEQANQTVQAGDRAMNNTVDSIVSIRQTVADAGKRVKRLSDSSQKISKVVSLISSFATQTNLLALNAALEATRAGEYGKGFAVVADEVRNLSLQSTEATIEIEKLVKEIQEETREVAAAMETGVTQVTEGTNLVNTTRESLNEIVTATAEIKGLVQAITSAANIQTQEAESVTIVMGQVADIANITSQDSNKISVSFQQLEQLAKNLQASVSQFKVK
jgi:methyl-accepting chemotaxis protein PixJ